MKKALVVLFVLVFPLSVLAMDINMGKIELSGNTSFNYSDMNADADGGGDMDFSNLSLNVDANYYIQKNLAVGALFMYQSAELGNLDLDVWMIGPQVVWNLPLNEKVNFFLSGAIGYASAEIENEDADGFGWQIGAGLKYFLTNSIAVNGSVKYQYLTLDADAGDLDIDGFMLGVGLSVFF